MLITGGGPRRRCRICGANHAACGPSTSTTPVDERIEIREVPTMAELREYRVRQGGMETTMKLSDEDAKNLYPDAVPVEDSGSGSDEDSGVKARTTSTRARTTENK